MVSAESGGTQLRLDLRAAEQMEGRRPKNIAGLERAAAERAPETIRETRGFELASSPPLQEGNQQGISLLEEAAEVAKELDPSAGGTDVGVGCPTDDDRVTIRKPRGTPIWRSGENLDGRAPGSQEVVSPRGQEGMALESGHFESLPVERQHLAATSGRRNEDPRSGNQVPLYEAPFPDPKPRVVVLAAPEFGTAFVGERTAPAQGLVRQHTEAETRCDVSCGKACSIEGAMEEEGRARAGASERAGSLARAPFGCRRPSLREERDGRFNPRLANLESTGAPPETPSQRIVVQPGGAVKKKAERLGHVPRPRRSRIDTTTRMIVA